MRSHWNVVSLQALTIHNAVVLNAFACSFVFLHQHFGLEQNVITFQSKMHYHVMSWQRQVVCLCWYSRMQHDRQLSLLLNNIVPQQHAHLQLLVFLLPISSTSWALDFVQSLSPLFKRYSTMLSCCTGIKEIIEHIYFSLLLTTSNCFFLFGAVTFLNFKFNNTLKTCSHAQSSPVFSDHSVQVRTKNTHSWVSGQAT